MPTRVRARFNDAAIADFYTTEKLSLRRSLTPEAFLLVVGVPVARTGTQLYRAGEVPIAAGPDGMIYVDRDPDEVFRPQTLASGNGKPLTIDHPFEDVTPDNWRELAMGEASDLRRGDGANDDMVLADFLIKDPATIAAVDAHELTEVSVGYDANYEEIEPGHGRQTNIVINHFALLGPGEARCGPRCSIGDHTKERNMTPNIVRFQRRAPGFLPARAATRDAATRRQTLYTHVPLESERLVLEERDDGGYDLVLISQTSDVLGKIASGNANRLAQMNDAAKKYWDGAEGGVTNTVTNAIEEATRLRERVGGDEPATGDRRATPARTIAGMNAAAKDFWAPRR